MRIDSLSVHNFRCFDDLQLEFDASFHVLIGKNGSGKTAVLEALAVAVGSWFLGIGGVESRSIRQEDVRLVGQRIGAEATFEPQYPVRVAAMGAVAGEQIGWSRSKEQPAGRTLQTTAWKLKQSAAEAVRKVRAGEPVTLPLIAYYGAGRLWEQPRGVEGKRPLNQSELSRLEGYVDALRARANARELHRWLEYQDRIAYQEGQESLLYRAVLNAMCAMLPDAADVQFNARRLEIVVTFQDSRVCPFGLLSDGQRNMLAIAGDIAARMTRLNPQFGQHALQETPGIVLIDELDLHLHPEWQRTISQSLSRTFNNVQFVATTHSPQIISELKSGQVTILEDPQHIDKPFQSYGMDSNFILRHVMHSPDRPAQIASRLRDIENLIKDEEYERAEHLIDSLRLEVGEFIELVRLQTRVERTRLLSR